MEFQQSSVGRSLLYAASPGVAQQEVGWSTFKVAHVVLNQLSWLSAKDPGFPPQAAWASSGYGGCIPRHVSQVHKIEMHS